MVFQNKCPKWRLTLVSATELGQQALIFSEMFLEPIVLTVPSCEAVELLNSCDFYTTKPLRVDDLGTEIKKKKLIFSFRVIISSFFLAKKPFLVHAHLLSLRNFFVS